MMQDWEKAKKDYELSLRTGSVGLGIGGCRIGSMSGLELSLIRNFSLHREDLCLVLNCLLILTTVEIVRRLGLAWAYRSAMI